MLQWIVLRKFAQSDARWGGGFLGSLEKLFHIIVIFNETPTNIGIRMTLSQFLLRVNTIIIIVVSLASQAFKLVRDLFIRRIIGYNYPDTQVKQLLLPRRGFCVCAKKLM